MQKRKRKKPTGTIGPISLNPETRSAELTLVQFPESKEDIERYVLNVTLTSARKRGLDLFQLIGDPIQNPESSFDFTLPTVRGHEYLDLIEIAPLAAVGGSFQKAPASYRVEDRAQDAFDLIIAKAKKYGQAARDPIHLLAYTTDWRLRLGQSVLDLLACWCSRGQHPFRTIIYYTPDDQHEGEVVKIFPRTPQELATIDETALRNRGVMVADTSRMMVESNGAIVLPLAPPPPRRKK